MATRGEQARAQAERTGKTKPSKQRKLAAKRGEWPKRAIDERVEREALAQTSGRSAGGTTARRNVKLDTGHASFGLEDSANGKATRKSTRKSANRSKTDSNLQRRQQRANHSPETRARRASAGAKKTRGGGARAAA